MTRAELAAAIGISTPQLVRYEQGYNRISASKLYEIALVLRVAVDLLFEPSESSTSGAEQIEMIDALRALNASTKLLKAFTAMGQDRRSQLIALIGKRAVTGKTLN